MNVKVKFLSEEAKRFGIPKFAYQGDAGVDLFTVLDEADRKEGKTIFPGDRQLLPSGLAFELPEGYWARITHRSSTEKRLRLRVVEGTIDQQYRGPIFVQVHNTSTWPITIKHGDRIAQMIFHKIYEPTFEEVLELADSTRGVKGFGSSGK